MPYYFSSSSSLLVVGGYTEMGGMDIPSGDTYRVGLVMLGTLTHTLQYSQ